MIDKLAVYILVTDKDDKNKIERCLWSIDNQPTSVEFDVVVNCQTEDSDFYELVKNAVPEEYVVFNTKGDGFFGNGINSCLKHYADHHWGSDCKWSHISIIKTSDYFYPMSFDLLNEIHDKSGFDYLSGMAHHVDSLRQIPPHRDDPRKVYPYQPKRWLWSFIDNRLPVFPFLFWDGENMNGEDFPLCASSKAVEVGLNTLEGDHDIAEYFLTLDAINHHVNKELTFVSTDCNEIYVQDCTEQTKFDSSKYDEERGYPFDANGLVYSEMNCDNYKSLAGITRQFFPYVTMPQVWSHREKCEFAARNELP